MTTQARPKKELDTSTFPLAEVKRRLRNELQRIADEATVLRPEWEPLLDSKRVVGTLLVVEDLFPPRTIPPDKVVRRGGYNSVDEAVEDLSSRIEALVARRATRKERR